MFVGSSNHVFIPELKKRKLCDVVEDYYSFLKVECTLQQSLF